MIYLIGQIVLKVLSNTPPARADMLSECYKNKRNQLICIYNARKEEEEKNKLSIAIKKDIKNVKNRRSSL